ncbi:MAG: accessory gene regulator B family protein [Clostridia bacterium]|nr:accessory gene regulator B family protein [Clostridia bacterium]
MIASASKKISKILFQKNIINENEQEICQYGLEIILSTSVGILLIVLIGIIMHLLVESIVFYSVFVGVRFFTGGYHASSHFTCKLVLSLCCFTVLFISKEFYELFNFGIQSLILLMSFITIYLFAPIEHSDAPVEAKTKIMNRRISILLSLTLSVIISIRYLIINKLSIVIDLTMLVISILLIIAKLKERSDENEYAS